MIYGQSIVLPGVTAAGASGARNLMSLGDSAAAQIPDLMTCFMAEAVTPKVGGGIQGYDVATSGLLIPAGVPQTKNDADANFAGMATVSVSKAGTISMPPGSAGGLLSYTVVMVTSLSAATLAAASNIMLDIAAPGDTQTAIPLRRLGTASATPGLNSLPYGGSSANGLTAAEDATFPAADVPGIYVLDWANDTKLARLAIQTPAVRASATLPNQFAAPTDANSYFRIGFLSSSGFEGRLARLYAYPRSLMSSTVGLSQLTALMSALRATYGVAA